MATVVVTGGSRGIGAATVAAFAARGDKVYFLYEKDHAAAAKVREETGATAICCDVADWEKVEAAFSILPSIDVLVCNAGIYIGGLFHQMDGKDFDRLMDVNVKGIFPLGASFQPLDGEVYLVAVDGKDHHFHILPFGKMLTDVADIGVRHLGNMYQTGLSLRQADECAKVGDGFYFAF